MQDNANAKQQYDKQYYAKNKERIKAATKQYRTTNRQQVNKNKAQWRLANKEKISGYQRAYRARNKERLTKRAADDMRRKVFGVTRAEYSAMLLSQGSVCAACHRPCRRSHELCVDHSHDTGKVRGLLCKDCNLALGHLKDDPRRCIGLLKYLQFHHGHDYHGHYKDDEVDVQSHDSVQASLFPDQEDTTREVI